MDLKMLWENFDVIVEAENGIQRLRDLILNFAVTGKLTERNLKDTPTLEIIEDTLQVKRELAKSKQIRKTKSLFPSEDLIEIDFPVKGWVSVPLGMLCFLLVDGSHNPPPKQENGIPMLSGQNVRDGYITFNASRFITEKDYLKEKSRTPIQEGDVFLSIVGSIGRSAVVPNDFPKCALQRSIALIRTKINSYYLSLFLRSGIAFEYYLKYGKGTAQKGIYLNKLSELMVPVPPLQEQKRIVSKVDELMKCCDRVEENLSKQEELASAISTSVIHHLKL